MFTLSDDKSAYGTLKGLVAALQKDIKDVQHKRDNYSPRSLDYARATGEIGGYNLTLSLITTCDVWVQGAREEATQPTVHYHVSCANGDVFTATDSETVRSWLRYRGVLNCDAFGLLAQGYLVSHCQRTDCLTTGKWLAGKVPSEPTTTRTNG